MNGWQPVEIIPRLLIADSRWPIRCGVTNAYRAFCD